MSSNDGPPEGRIELYGASNLWLSRRAALAAARQRFEGPIEIGLACGPGRSYGLRAGNPLVRYPPLRDVVFPRAAEVPTVAILSDVGNDIAYSQRPDTAAGWVAELAARLERQRTQVVLTGVPVDSLRGLPSWLFVILRSLYYAGQTVTREDVMQRLDDLQAALKQLASQRGYLFLPTDSRWYGLDRFHLRSAAYQPCWDEWMERLRPLNGLARPATEISSLRLWALRPANYWFRGQPRQGAGEYLDLLPSTRLLVR
jgi:hypothetical protein